MRNSAPGPNAWRKALALALFLAAWSAPALGQDRELGFQVGLGLADFHGCPAFGLSAALPLALRFSLEVEAFYYFNPAEAEKNPPAGFHQSSMAAGLGAGASFRLAEKEGRFIPYLAAGIGYLYTSVLTDRPPAARVIESRSRFSASLAAGARIRLVRSLGLQIEARGLLLSAGGGGVLRLAAGLYTNF